jgi:hypothetical protein
MITKVEVIGSSEIIDNEILAEGVFFKLKDAISFIEHQLTEEKVDLEGNDISINVFIERFNYNIRNNYIFKKKEEKS